MEKEREYLKGEFSKMAVNGGKCGFINEALGKKQIKDFLKYLIV